MVFSGYVSGRAGGVLLAAAGAFLLLLGLRSALGTRRFLRGATRAEGSVTTLNAGGSHPQICFVLPDGRVVSYPQGGFVFGYRPGERVRVLFDPADPADSATVDAIGAVWFWSILLGGLGMTLLAAGVTVVLGAGTAGAGG